MPSVTEAAEELIRAARIEVESQGKANEKDTLAELKQIRESTVKVQQSIRELGTANDDASKKMQDVLRTEQGRVISSLAEVRDSVKQAASKACSGP